MSQEQPRKPGNYLQDQDRDHEPIRYGELFNVSGELASKPITPRDAATLQSAESQVLGQTQRGGPAAVMDSAATKNERAGLVGHNAATSIVRNEGVTISETNEGGNRVITETVGGQVVGKFVGAEELKRATSGSGGDQDAVNMTEDALGSTVDEGVPVSVQAPEVRATKDDRDFISNQDVATKFAGAYLNPRLSGNEDEDTLSNVNDKRVMNDENPNVISSVPGGMAASMATADHRVKKNK